MKNDNDEETTIFRQHLIMLYIKIDLRLYTSLDLCVDAMPWHRDHQRYYHQQLSSYIIVDIKVRRMMFYILLSLALIRIKYNNDVFTYIYRLPYK